MHNRNYLTALTSQLHPHLRTITHCGRPYARYLDLTARLLLALSASPSRLLDTFAADWAMSGPERKQEMARNVLTPRSLCADVARRACALSARRVTVIVDEGFETLRGLVFADRFLDPDTSELRQALTLRGLDGANAFLVLVSRHHQPIRGLARGCQFVSRIAQTIRAGEESAGINALVAIRSPHRRAAESTWAL